MVKDVTPTPLNDEQQSLQALRQYGGYIISAIILALAGYFGWNYYQNHGGRIDQKAVDDYAKIQTAHENLATLSEQAATDANAQKQLTATQASLNQDLDSYIAEHGNGIYTWQALMLKAKQQADSNDFKGAIATLKRASALKLGDAGLEAITTLRYAQALLADNQADAASQALQGTMPAAFEASKEELLGDIAMQKNDKNSAISHYQKAWAQIEARNRDNDAKVDRALLRVKMESLGLTPKQPDLSDKVITKSSVQPANQASAVASTPIAMPDTATHTKPATASTPAPASAS